MKIVKIQCIAFGHSRTLTALQFVVCITLMLLLSMSIYLDRDVVICFKEILKDTNVNLIIEQIKLVFLFYGIKRCKWN